jgi:(2Fe-2S) ferredoxin
LLKYLYKAIRGEEMGRIVDYSILKKICSEKTIEEKHSKIKIVVQLSKCSVAVGADDVLSAIQQTIKKEQINSIILEITGCAGLCHKEPIVTVYTKEGEISYELVNEEKAKVITISHGLYGKIVWPWVLKK